MFEALDDAGLVTAAVNTYVIRGRTRHPITRPTARRLARRIGIVDAVYGPRRYFLGDLFFSDRTGAPLNLGGGGVDRHGGQVGRWLVTRDGFDFLFFYLYETDAVQHRGGDALRRGGRGRPQPGAAGRGGRRPGAVPRPLRGDPGRRPLPEPRSSAPPTPPSRSRDLRLFRGSRRSGPDDCDLAVAASNRAAMIYLLPGAPAELGADRRSARWPSSAADWSCCTRRRLVRGPAGGRRAALPARTGCRRAREQLPGRGRPRAARPSASIPTRWSGSRGCWPARGRATWSCRRPSARVPRRRRHPPRGRRQPRLAARGRLAGAAGHRGLRGPSSGLPDVPSITDLTPMAFRHFGVG